MNKVINGLKWFYKSLIWVVILVIALDVSTKWITLTTIGIDNSIEVIPNFFYLAVSINDGAAWSMLAGKRIFWMMISIVLSGCLIAYYAITYKKNNWWMRVGVVLMIAGALGNMVDRCFYWPNITGIEKLDGVIDFLSFHFGSFVFPTFNAADMSLVIGVGIILVYMIYEMIKDAIAKGKSGAYTMKPEEYEAKIKAENEAKQSVEVVDVESKDIEPKDEENSSK